jgi:hypothetical protein
MYRNPALLALARHAPHCMSCLKPNDGTVVAAHSNQLRDGKGRSLKAHDFRIAMCCGQCHHEIDQGRALSRDERVARWEEAHRRTIGWLFESGCVVVWRPPADLIEEPPPAPKPKRAFPKRKMQKTGRKIPTRRMETRR